MKESALASTDPATMMLLSLARRRRENPTRREDTIVSGGEMATVAGELSEAGSVPAKDPISSTPPHLVNWSVRRHVTLHSIRISCRGSAQSCFFLYRFIIDSRKPSRFRIVGFGL